MCKLPQTPPAESTDGLDRIRMDVTVCTKCSLCQTRTKSVPGRGSSTADIMFVGEAPGRSEDMAGKPFVGMAGKRLDLAMQKAGIDEGLAYITNVVKCRPPDNRVPMQAEKDMCAEYLEGEIMTINPKVICVMGNTAFGSLLGGSNITKFRGRLFSKEQRIYFVSLHPAATIYNQSLTDTLEKDIARLVDIVKRIKSGEEIKIDYKVAA